MEENSHGTSRAASHPGDLFNAEVMQVPEGHDLPLSGRQGKHLLADQGALLVGNCLCDGSGSTESGIRSRTITPLLLEVRQLRIELCAMRKSQDW